MRYSVLRLLIFFGFFFFFWLIGLRENVILLLGASALASGLASYLLLRGMRDEMTAKLAERLENRSERRDRPMRDNLDEDAEIDPDSHVAE